MIFKLISILLLIGSISCQAWTVDYWLYDRSNGNTPRQITTISGTSFNKAKCTKLLIHGFGSSWQTNSQTPVANAFIQRTDCNVISINWSGGATSPNYFAAAPNTKIVGTRVAQFLIDNGISASSVHCFGHSLGAHCCGFTAKTLFTQTASRIARITGSDPAGPLFAGKPKEERLDVSDATLVDCIHCDSTLGIQESICGKNFKPNGGAIQPNCGVEIGRRSADNKDFDDEYLKMIYHLKLSPDRAIVDLVGCSHNKCPHYFAESIHNNCAFSATPCNTWANFQEGNCQCTPQHGCPRLGFYADRTTELGTFFLNVNNESPYCKF